jgi:hypothetical protein
MMANIPDHRQVTPPKNDSFALMKLPPEQRIIIYDYYFAKINKAQWFLSSVCTPKTPRSARILPGTKTSLKALRPYLPILRANAAVRAEAGPIFYNKNIPSVDFLFNIDYHNAADNFRRIQGLCRSFAAVSKASTSDFGVQIFTNAKDKPFLLELADRIHQYAAWQLQRRGIRQHGLMDIDGSIDKDKLAKLGLSTEENAFLTYNLQEMPCLVKLELAGREGLFASLIPGFEMHYANRMFRIFGPLAMVDWEDFDFENVPWYLPSSDGYDEFVHEDQCNEVAGMSDSDGEPRETDLYDIWDADSDDGGSNADFGVCSEYGSGDDLDGDDEAAYFDNEFDEEDVDFGDDG